MNTMRSAALHAVRAAAGLAAHVQRSLHATAGTAVKADASPVTIGDYAAQAIVCMLLRGALPADEFQIMAEEDAATLMEGDLAAHVVDAVNQCLARTPSLSSHPPLTLASLVDVLNHGRVDPAALPDRYWVLDPIDGTKGFLRPGGQWAVGLALCVAGQPQFAAVACPAMRGAVEGEVGCLLHATRGGGVHMQRLQEGSEDVRVTMRVPRDVTHLQLCEGRESGASNFAESTALRGALGMTPDPVRIDSMCKYAMLARGDGDLYVRFPRGIENVWDHMPGALLVTEAGGVITDFKGHPLDFTTGTKLIRHAGIIACHPSVHGAVLAAVQRVMAV